MMHVRQEVSIHYLGGVLMVDGRAYCQSDYLSIEGKGRNKEACF